MTIGQTEIPSETSNRGGWTNESPSSHTLGNVDAVYETSSSHMERSFRNNNGSLSTGKKNELFGAADSKRTEGNSNFGTSKLERFKPASSKGSKRETNTESVREQDAVSLLVDVDELEEMQETLESQRRLIKEQSQMIQYLQDSRSTASEKYLETEKGLDDNDCTVNISAVDSYRQRAEIVRSSSFQRKETRLPQDIYSFFIISRPNSLQFIFAAIVHMFQVTILCFLAMDQISPNSDNPLNIPPNVETSVHFAQFMTLIVAVLTQEDLREALELLSGGYSDDRLKSGFPNASSKKWYLSCMLRFLEGALGLTATFLVIVSESSVIELLLNFTALEFVSQLDNIAFFLSSTGYFGKKLMRTSHSIAETTFPFPIVPKSERWQHSILLFLVFVIMIGGWTVLVYQQLNDHYLCKEIFVQFGDESSSELGAYTGLYIMEDGDRRNNNRARYSNTGWTTGTFSYCTGKKIWVFAPTGDIDNPCDDWLVRSAETKTFDLLETEESSAWTARYHGYENGIQVDHLRLTCTDQDTRGDTCKKTICNDCPRDTYGLNCTSAYPPCKFIDFDDDSDGFVSKDKEVVKNFRIFEVEGIDKSYQFHYSPIYVPQEDDSNHEYLIFFGGRRWYFSNVLLDDNISSTVKDYIVNAFSNIERLPNATELAPLTTYVSEAIDIISIQEATSPVGLHWFHASKSIDLEGLPLPNSGKPINSIFSCGFCDNVTNPCLYGGSCRPDGNCDCKHNAKGHLCINAPIGNGNCDDYFNTKEHNYDGGDCCGATCMDALTQESCRGGLLETSTKQFGVELEYGGRGYPNCKDPSMTGVIIEIRVGLSSLDVDVLLVCDGLAYLYLPKGALHVQNHTTFNGTQVVQVQDGADCALEVTLHDERAQVGVVDFDFESKVYLANQKDAVLSQNKSRVWLDGNSSSFKLPPFFVSSLLKKLSQYTALSDLESNSTPQGDAIRILSTDPYPHASLDNKYLLQRYAIYVMNFAFGDPLGLKSKTNKSRLYSVDECAFRSLSKCNDDGYIKSIDLSRGSYSGSIPSEVSLFHGLEDFYLRYNSFTGSLPTELGELENLRNLYLYENKFDGKIPSEIGNLKNLTILDIRGNSLSGTIPTEIYQLTNLEVLNLSDNEINGTVSDKVSDLVNLKNFVIENAQLEGSLPPSLGTITNLIELDVEGNFLTGPIPSELGALSLLGEIDLESNRLTGAIPSELGNLMNLNVLVLKNNLKLTGTIPTKLCSLKIAFVSVDCTNVTCPQQDCAKICSNNCKSSP